MAARQPPPSSASAPAAGLSMKEYLKRYQSGPGADGDQKKAKKKTKKKPKPTAGGGGVLIVDEDPVWQKPVQVEEEPASSGDEKPLVDEDIEVKRMRRLEAIRAARPYNAIAEDGSGWVTVAAPEEQGGGSTRQLRNDTPSPEQGGAVREDLSPVRRRQRRDTPSPVQGDAAGKDLSPPRQRRRRQDTPSPKGSGAGDQDDMSPPRKSRRKKDPSPPRKGARHISEEPQDTSPPRRRRRHDSEEPQDTLLPRRRVRHDSVESEDISPPRRRTRQDSEGPEDISPPRRRKHQDPEDISPPRRRKHQDPEDISPPRRRTHQDPDGDLSPPRRNNLGQSHKSATDELSPRKKRDTSPSRNSKKERASKHVMKAGLMTAEEVKEDIRKIKETEMAKFASQDPSLVGKGAKAVFRDKEGRRISEEEMRKAKEPEKPKEIHIEWGKGLVQKREAEARLKEIEAEKKKPFARTRDDPELDNMLKERIRWGDPMAHLVKRKDPEFILEDLGDDEKMKESGFIVPQNVPPHSWLKRGVDAPPNRYGIKPGRHWDGVDRSNGFEKDMFKLKNEKQAMEQEAYLWSVSDM
ncbi:BUD13 homolog isoform X2 [Sorghum bicolor]|uniref:BUD13 homolog isoform X2 n=1 Tax=Sorghum bicolor TaxID=4558 RepID=UPI000B426147|nr:BUD13 homolog isoform X2 [Sorghum bicolor]|eukprot:XP_021305715.1 BUD13 homolog isoform X2 [Sorghum bicolor]